MKRANCSVQFMFRLWNLQKVSNIHYRKIPEINCRTPLIWIICRIEAHGTVQLNEKQRISKFTANDGTFFLEDDRKRLSLDATRLEFVKLMGFLIEKTKDAVEPLPNTKLIFQEFSQIEPVKKPNDTDIMYKWDEHSMFSLHKFNSDFAVVWPHIWTNGMTTVLKTEFD